MTKQGLVNAVIIKTGMLKSDAVKSVEAVFESMADCFEKGCNLQIRGFATFEVKNRAPRCARDINKGIAVQIPAYRTVKLTLSPNLKARINK